MPEIKHRQENASPEIEYAEIHIPDDRVLGTGSFKTVIKPGGLSKEKVVSSIMINVPVFQISVNLNPSTGEIPVLLGLADDSAPISSRTFIIPDDVDFSDKHEFEATFKSWRVVKLCMDGAPLSSPTEGLLPAGTPIPEHEGTLELLTPNPHLNLTEETKNKTLDDIFDLSKYFTFYQVKWGNSEINIYRNLDFQIVYRHYNPSFGERELNIDFADAEREGARGFYIAATWSPSQNSLYVGLYHLNPKFEGLRSNFVLSEDKLKLIRENIEELEELANTPGSEEEAHQFLKNNSVILGLLSTIEPISKFKLGDDYVTDFVLKEIPDGYVFIEIEKPGMRFFKKTTPPERTQEFNHAIQQIENWKAWIAENHAYISGKLPGISPNPVFWLIAGRITNLSAEEKKRLAEINEQYRTVCKIFTYDDLIDRVEAVISKMS